jgi:hypothetical protein
MTNEQFEGLKQLIDARASATEKYLEQRIEDLCRELKGDIQELRADLSL